MKLEDLTPKQLQKYRHAYNELIRRRKANKAARKMRKANRRG